MSQRQCLPICDNSDESDSSEINFDLNQISAHKYLKSVRMERENLCETVSVTNVYNQDIQVQPSRIARQIQTKEWQDYQKELFETVQKKICKIRNAESNEEKLFDQLPMNIDDEIECIKYCQENEPLLSIIFTLDSFRQTENLIELLADHFTEILENLKLKDLHEVSRDFTWAGQWIYALIAGLRIPLSPEAHSSIRMIAKNCIYLVDHFKPLDEFSYDSRHLSPFNLLITIIVNNFHQHDLLSL